MTHHPPPRHEILNDDSPRILPNHFLTNSHDSQRPPRGLTPRDGIAMAEMIGALMKHGFKLGDQYIHWPGPIERDEHGDYVPPRPNQLHKVPIVARPGDLILTVTRVVTHPEVEQWERRGSLPAGTDLEAVLAARWRTYFSLYTRTTMSLAPELRSQLIAGYESRKHVTFRQALRRDHASESEASLYRTLARKPYTDEPRTAGFVLRLPELWKGGPGYVGLACTTGSTNAALARILATRLLDLLREPLFAMIELSPGQIPERASNLRFADSWDAKVILHLRIK